MHSEWCHTQNFGFKCDTKNLWQMSWPKWANTEGKSDIQIFFINKLLKIFQMLKLTENKPLGGWVGRESDCYSRWCRYAPALSVKRSEKCLPGDRISLLTWFGVHVNQKVLCWITNWFHATQTFMQTNKHVTCQVIISQSFRNEKKKDRYWG